MTDKTASELAAERLGFGNLDPHAEVLGDLEDLLSRDEWDAADRDAARDAIERAKKLPAREPEPVADAEKKPAKTASELAAERLSGQREGARRSSRGWQ